MRPLRFQTAVHPLDVLLRDEGDLLVAQLRLDVVFDVAAVALEGTGPHRARLVLRKPTIQPLTQRHAAVLGQLHIPVALDVLMEFVQQRLLRLGIDVAKQRLAVSRCPMTMRPSHRPSSRFRTMPSPAGLRFAMYFTSLDSFLFATQTTTTLLRK